MKPYTLLVMLALLCTGCANGLKLVHTPPGTSVEVALARRAEMVRQPGPPPGSIPVRTRIPAVEPELPRIDKTGQIADAFTRAQFCMKTGADDEAIAGFQEVVKLDPDFFEAWHNLAALYERKGDDKKAMEAFRAAKSVAQH